MPIISMFYGIIIEMYFRDHSPPHFHAIYQDQEAMFDLSGKIINGRLPSKQAKMVEVWCGIHHDELVANWKMASTKNTTFKIDPLK